MKQGRWLGGLLFMLMGMRGALATEGEPLSLNFQDVEVRAVLQIMADYVGVNLVASDTVQGRITLRLEQVPWQQALDLVLRSRGLGHRQEGNVLLVAPWRNWPSGLRAFARSRPCKRSWRRCNVH